MRPLRRLNVHPGTYFVTVVTLNRNPILLPNVDLFQESWRLRRPTAWVLLPDHFHVILQTGEYPLSRLLHDFKITFYHGYRRDNGPGRIWQNRFWDHLIRDLDDLQRHLDYIHYNPVHHGLLTHPGEYRFSSLSKWIAAGFYDPSWGATEIESPEGEFGE